MKVLTVIGVRSQFIKAAVVSRKLREKFQEILVHTGQHYDYNMSEQFFDELEIPKPDYNLGIKGDSHGQMTGKMLMTIEEVLLKEKTDIVLVYGDTNSTLAAALAAVKLHIPVCHVEAGIRTHSMTNPEEINRICTDHISSLLLTVTMPCIDNLKAEGIKENIYFVGDPMYDAYLLYKDKLKIDKLKLKNIRDGKMVRIPDDFYYMTCHREENSYDIKFLEILKAADSLDAPTIYPVHPRNKGRALRMNEKYGFDKVIMTEPVGYLESLALLNKCKKVITDSGGLQREVFFARKQCVTIFDFASWPETMIENRNQLARPDYADILNKLETPMIINDMYMPFGDGKSAEKIVNLIISR